MKRPLATMMLACLALAGTMAPAHAQGPPRPPKPPRHHGHIHPASMKRPVGPADPASIREVKSDLCATTARAEADVIRHLEAEAKSWLGEDGVPASWDIPQPMIDHLVAGKITVEPVQVKELTVFRATVPAEFSPRMKRPILDRYHREIGGRRLGVLGGILALVLACLAAFSGYVRAAEATKGYYTNRLRLIAAAGGGAAGVAVYRLLT